MASTTLAHLPRALVTVVLISWLSLTARANDFMQQVRNGSFSECDNQLRSSNSHSVSSGRITLFLFQLPPNAIPSTFNGQGVQILGTSANNNCLGLFSPDRSLAPVRSLRTIFKFTPRQFVSFSMRSSWMTKLRSAYVYPFIVPAGSSLNFVCLLSVVVRTSNLISPQGLHCSFRSWHFSMYYQSRSFFYLRI